MSNLRGFKLRLTLARIVLTDAFVQSYKSTLSYLHYLKNRVLNSMTIESQIDTLIAQVGDLVDAASVKTQYFDTVIANAQSATSNANTLLLNTTAIVSQAETARDEAQQVATDLGDLQTALTEAGDAADRAELAATNALTVVTQDLSAIDADLSDGGAFSYPISACWFGSSLDSDPTWPDRLQGRLGWYNEPLNTDIRGAQREYPALGIAALLKTSEGYELRLYSCDYGAPQMWMRIPLVDNNVGTLFWAATVGPVETSKISMREGWLVLGAMANYGVRALDFTTNRMLSSRGNPFKGIEARAETWASDKVSTERSWAEVIGARSVLCATVAVLDGAPINPETGMPMPTAIMGDFNYTRLVRDDGFYVRLSNLTDDVWSVAVRAVDGSIVNTTFPNGRALRGNVFHPPFVDGEVRTSADEIISYATDGPTKHMKHTSVSPSYMRVLEDGETYVHEYGAFRWRGNAIAPENGAIARITRDFNTGWMHGDCVLALSDNRTDTAGADVELCPDPEIQDAAAWQDANNMTGAVITQGQIALSTEASGYFYPVGFDTDMPEGAYLVTISGTAGASVNLSTVTGMIGSVELNVPTVFYKPNPKNGIRLHFSGGEDFVITGVSFKPLLSDRSTYETVLNLSGTLARSPVATGADLSCLSGFSGSNFVSLAGDNFDFGTGDFSIVAWVRDDAPTSQSNAIIGRGLSSSDQRWYLRSSWGTGYLSFRMENGGDGVTLNGTRNVQSGEWRQIAVTRSAGVLSLYVDGVLDASVSAPDIDLSFSAGDVFIGVIEPGATTNFMSGDLALLRVSKGAASAERIAFSYAQERPLFREGARCVFPSAFGHIKGGNHGAFDPVDRLAYIGGENGTAVFDGLCLVSEIAGANNRFIAAHGGAVIVK